MYRLVLAMVAVVLVIALLGCSVGQLLVPSPPPTPTLAIAPTLRPTFTPMSPATDTPVPTDTPLPTPTPTPTATLPPTETPTPMPLDTPTPTPLPAIRAVTTIGELNYRTGPGSSYPSLGKLARGVSLAVVGRLEDDSWFKVCCLEGRDGWVSGQFLQLDMPSEQVPIDASAPPPPPATATPVRVARPATDTPVPPTPAPQFRFSLQSREEFATTNDFLDIGVRIYNGQKDNFLPGFRVKLIDRTHGLEYFSKVSTSTHFWTDMEGYGAARRANVNFDLIPLFGPTDWIMYVVDDGNNRLSADVAFSLSPKTVKLYFVFMGN